MVVWDVLRPIDGRWETTATFNTLSEAKAFMNGVEQALCVFVSRSAYDDFTAGYLRGENRRWRICPRREEK